MLGDEDAQIVLGRHQAYPQVHVLRLDLLLGERLTRRRVDELGILAF